MPVSVRRVVTGHDINGRARVLIDETASRTIAFREGCDTALIWTTEGFPSSNDGVSDRSQAHVATTIENGAVFRVIDYAPGVAPRRHRTLSIDFAVVMKGEIYMELEDGEEIFLKEGDVLVQQGTIHNWINRGADVCRIAFVLLSASPVHVGDDELPAHG
ncbi:MAG: cupin domain-containing protein [Maricaulaceae bacterium]|jgi:quercetin dioxygenase-like cupin family protein